MAPIVHSPSQNDHPNNDDDDDFLSRQAVMSSFESDPSSDEDDAVDIGGYQLLPQDTDNDDGIELVVESVFDANEVEDSMRNQEVPEIPSLSSEENIVEERPSEIVDSCPMNREHVEKIKEAMAGFTLPCSSVPNWAFNIPEDEWKEKLVTILQKRTN